jgi:hypothetical protein
MGAMQGMTTCKYMSLSLAFGRAHSFQNASWKTRLDRVNAAWLEIRSSEQKERENVLGASKTNKRERDPVTVPLTNTDKQERNSWNENVIKRNRERVQRRNREEELPWSE